MQLELSHHARVRLAGATVELAPRDAALLAWLALEGPTPRTRLAALLWPASAAVAARNALRQRLFQLRRQLGADAVTGSATLALAEGVAHDLADSDTVLGDEADEIGGEFTAWLEQQRARRRARVRTSLAELSAMAEAAHDWTDALAHANELLALEPLSEEAHRRVMRLHYLAGDRAAALLAFDRCERVLKDEVGAAPSAETLAVLRTVEGSAVALPLAQQRLGGAALMRPPRLIGRSVQWGALERAHADRLVALVEGEAGMGKSRLVGDFAQRDPAHTLRAGARPGDANVPYGCLVRLVRALIERAGAPSAPLQRTLARLLPEYGDAPAGADAAQAARLLAALDTLLASAVGVGVQLVVVDDLHFADGASAEALGRLAAARADVAWIFAVRPSEWSAAARAAADMLVQAGRACTIELPALSPPEIAELVDSLEVPGWSGQELAPRLARHTGGNPLFLLETLKSMPPGGDGRAPGLPAAASVAQLIGWRVGRLSTDAVKIARCAALAGQDFSSELATHLLGARPLDLADAWAELEAAQVLREQAFAHDLIREAALASVPPPLARQLHGQIAEFLAAHDGAPQRIAAHWLASARPQAAVPHLIEAGRGAIRALRKSEAGGFLMQAADLLEAAGDRSGAFDSLELFFEQALPMWDALSQQLIQRLLALAETPLQRATAGMHHADLLSRAGDFAASGAAAEAALRLFDHAQAPALTATLMNFAVAAHLQRGEVDAAVRTMYRAVAIAETSGDDESVYTTVATLGAALDWAGRYAEAEPHQVRALELAKRLGQPEQMIAASINVMSNRIEVGHLQAARAMFEFAERVAASHDIALGDEWPTALAQRARLALDLGDYTGAVWRYEAARQLVERRMPHWLIGVDNGITVLWMRLGQWARAQQAVRGALARADGAIALYAARAHMLAAEVEAGSGQRTAAEGRLAVLDAAQTLLGSGGGRVLRQIELSRTRWLEPHAGLALARRVRDAAQADGVACVVLDAEVRAAQAALRGGAVDAAAAHAHRALALFEEVEPHSLYRAEVWLGAAQALEASDPARAAAVLRHAQQWIRDTARERVPEPFRDSFLQRNGVNRELLALAARLTLR